MLVGLLGCVDPDEGGEPEPFDVVESGTTTTGTGGEPSYPAGPYGVARGQVIQNFEFSGFPAPDVDNSTMAPVRLQDFFNPTGDGVFPEGSPLGAGTPKPRAVGVVVGAVWCAPCQEEARRDLPREYARVKPIGGELVFVLVDSNEPGSPATQQDLVRWTDTFHNVYPSVLDPSYAVGNVINASSFPANILIDTRDMSIVDIVAGIPPESYWDEFETLARGD